MRIETEVSIERFLDELSNCFLSKSDENTITTFCGRWLKYNNDVYIPENLKEEELLTAFIDATNKYTYEEILDKLK